MNITEDYLKRVEAAAKAYDAEKNMEKKHELGRQFDELTSTLSDGQIKQVVNRLNRI